MNQLIPYLIFSGDCHDALRFYADCLDGEIKGLQTIGDSPIAAPQAHHDRVFDATFETENIKFKASDDMPNQETPKGENFAMFLTFSDPKEQAVRFTKLAQGGQILFPLEKGFGMLVDRFNIRWMLAYHP